MKKFEEEIKKLFESPDEKIQSEIEETIEVIYAGLKNSKRFLAITKKINWKKLIEKFDEKFETLYSSFNLTQIQSGLFANKQYFKRRILKEFRDKILLDILISEKSIEDKNINRTIDYFISQYKAQHLIEGIKLEESRKLLEAKEKIANKYLGKKYKSENLDIYALIYKKNDEYIESGKEGNFRRAANTVIKSGNFESKYKSFNKFKNTQGILTYKDFINFRSTIGE